uniref:Uncharacterized protein n=1 Tax=Anguilla anguilla TaxID=7936 RepID=A0A0E9Q6I4_ANGAN
MLLFSLLHCSGYLNALCYLCHSLTTIAIELPMFAC